MPAAVAALGTAARRVFLALGRNELRPFEAAPQHFYLVRSVDAPEAHRESMARSMVLARVQPLSRVCDLDILPESARSRARIHMSLE